MLDYCIARPISEFEPVIQAINSQNPLIEAPTIISLFQDSTSVGPESELKDKQSFM